jgi:hypothetical protein
MQCIIRDQAIEGTLFFFAIPSDSLLARRMSSGKSVRLGGLMREVRRGHVIYAIVHFMFYFYK